MSDNEDDNTNRNKELLKISRKKVATKNVVEQTVEMQKSIKSELLYACDMEECDLKCIRLYADVYRDELEMLKCALKMHKKTVEMEKSISDTESDGIIQRKESKKKATKRLLLKRLIKKQAEKKNKQKSTESESDSDFEVGTFDKYNRVESKKKGKMLVVEKNYDYEDAMCAKKKRKRNKQENSMMVAYKAEAKVIEDLISMGLEWNCILALWVVNNFNPKTCTLVMEDGSMIKITRVLIHDMLGILMGDIKVKSLKEKNLFDPVTAKWRGIKNFWGGKKYSFKIAKETKHYNKIKTQPYLDEQLKYIQMIGAPDVFRIIGDGVYSLVASDKFSGPLYMSIQLQQEELDLKGFGLLPIVKGLEFIEPKKVNKKKKLKSITKDEDETPEKEMKKILKDNLLKRRNLIEDTDNKLDIALAINSDDKENELFVTLYKDKDLEKDDDDEETDGDDDDNAPDGDNDDKDDDETDGHNDDKDDDDKDENNDKNDDKTNRDNDDETHGDNDDIDEDDDDENDDNDENDEKRKEKQQ
ncbi:hypothetical protein Tco_0897042 [Tanacetum coccineum]